MIARRSIWFWLLSIGLVLSFAPRRAAAAPSSDDVAAAQRLFEEGLSLMDAKRYPEACARLKESQRLDPGMGTEFRLAECFEAGGWIGSAWRLFVNVAEEAAQAGRGDRETQSRQRAKALEPRLSRISITIAPATLSLPEFRARRDGEDIAPADLAAPMVVDPGSHGLSITARGKKTWEQTVRALEGETVQVRVPPLDDAPAPKAPPTSSATRDRSGPPSTQRRDQRIAAVVVGSIGLLSIGAGTATGLLAKSKWDDALGGCAGGVTTRCSDHAIASGKTASNLAIASTVTFVVGGAAIVTAPILWFAVPAAEPGQPHKVELETRFGPGQFSAVLGGAF